MPNERSGTHVTQDLGARHVNEGMFTTVVILNEKSFRSLIEARSLQLHVCRLQWSSFWWWVVRGTQRLCPALPFQLPDPHSEGRC